MDNSFSSNRFNCWVFLISGSGAAAASCDDAVGCPEAAVVVWAYLFLYRVLPVFRRHCLHEEIIFLRYGCGADCFGNFWCITATRTALRFFHRHSSLATPTVEVLY
ncbi:MAG: hypothetical protein ACLVGL_06900 [Waltera sp.]